MRYVLLEGRKVHEGDDITITGADGFQFEVIEIKMTYFKVRWIGGERNDRYDIFPYSVFRKGGVDVEVFDTEEKDPNAAFRRSKNG